MLNLIQWPQGRLNDPVHAYQIYHSGRYLISLIISVIMVKCGIPSSDLGDFELIIFIVASFSFFWSVGIKNALISFYPKVDEKSQNTFLHTAFVILIFIGFISGLFIMIFPHIVSYIFAKQGKISYLNLAGLYLILSSPLLMTENVLLLRRDASGLFYYLLWSSGGTLFLAISVALFYPSIQGFLYTLIVFSFFRLIYLCYIIKFFRFPEIDLTVAKTFLLFSLPIIINVFIGSAMDFIDGWFVTKYYDATTFVIFRYGARELPLSMVLYTSLSAALIPTLMSGGIKSHELKRRATNLMHYIFPVTILLIFTSPFLFTWAYSRDFRESAFIFNIYLLILTSRVLLPQAYNFALHQHKVIIYTGIIEVLCNIILSYWWMHIWGVYGLAFATVAAYFVQKVLLIIYNKLKNGIELNQYIDFKYYFVYSIMLFVSLYCSFKFH